MNRIEYKRRLNQNTVMMKVAAPLIAKKAKPGQFIMLRVNEGGERIPLTIAEAADGCITIIFQEVGKTTKELGQLSEGGYILDFVGPLGNASHLDGLKRACVIGGGLGTAIAYPQAKYLHGIGCEVDVIAGFRNKDLIMLEDEMKASSTNLFVATDDGSNGNKGFVTNILKEQLEKGVKYDEVIAIGPVVMMRAVCNVTKEYGIKTTISMNSIMVDGTGMCGGCRLTVDGKVKFACVDGPDFDGHAVDFDEIIRRSGIYAEQEKTKLNEHICKMEAAANVE